MRFRQLDTISELDPGRRIVAQRTLRAEEEYLRDHFPRFPVMPGVLMLEALYQAAVWMLRTGDGFRSPLVLLKEAKGVKFADFLAPGETLEITAEVVKEEGPLVTVKALARKGDRTTVSARLILERRSPTEDRCVPDEEIRDRVKAQYERLFARPAIPAAVS